MNQSVRMYRAVERHGFDATVSQVARMTRRLPSNVPYAIDNIWEWLRPDWAPNRRHAIYASPTPALALRNASGAGAERERYIVCELAMHGPAPKIAHLSVTDARLHPDIAELTRVLHKEIGTDFADRTLLEKQSSAALFLPGVSKDELTSYFDSGERQREMALKLREVSRFWHDARDAACPDCDGELFFELPPAAFFTLSPLAATTDANA